MLQKIGLLVLILFCTIAGYAVVTPTVPSTTIADNNSMTLEHLLALSPKNFEKATGTHLSFKEKIAYRLVQWKLRRQLNASNNNDADETRSIRNSKSALFCGIATWGLLILGLAVPIIGVFSIPFSIAALIYGFISLNKTPNNTKSIIGIVLGGTYLLLFAVALLLIASLTSL